MNKYISEQSIWFIYPKRRDRLQQSPLFTIRRGTYESCISLGLAVIPAECRGTLPVLKQ